MREITLGNRLLSVAELVRGGAVFADVGTDHAYLPLFLLKNGKIERAICSDINVGPLENARANAKEYGLTDKISFVLTDGAVALSGLGITDMAICGMGGELIADIIEAAPFIKNERVHLILQPMTKQEHLRKYLLKNGFEITGEVYSAEGKRSYITLEAEYTGTATPISCERILGCAVYECAEAQEAYLTSKLNSMKRELMGKRASGEDTAVLGEQVLYTQNLVNSLKKYIQEKEK